MLAAQGAARGVQGEGGHRQRGAIGVKPHVLHPLTPVSAGYCSPAAVGSYSEPGSMGECRGLGDSHGRHVGRMVVGREEQVGFFRRFPHPSPPHHHHPPS